MNVTLLQQKLDEITSLLDEVLYPDLREVQITPEDKLLLTKIREVLNTKITQIRERYDVITNQVDERQSDLEDVNVFLGQLDEAIQSLDGVLEYQWR